MISMWNDTRLAWNPEDHDGLSSLRIDAHHVWVPDVTVYNTAENTESMYVDWKSVPK